MNEHKLRKRIKKLRALAEHGIGGEAENAKRLLDELLKEHGIKLEDIGEHIRIWEMTSLNESGVILEKVIKSVCPEATIIVKKHKSRLIVEVPLSDIHYQEVRQKHKFFWDAYNDERKIFLSAFFNKNAEYFIPERKDKPNPNPHPSNSDSKQQPPHIPTPTPPLQDVPDTLGNPMNTWERKRVGIMMQALRFLHYVKLTRMTSNRMIEKKCQ